MSHSELNIDCVLYVKEKLKIPVNKGLLMILAITLSKELTADT